MCCGRGRTSIPSSAGRPAPATRPAHLPRGQAAGHSVAFFQYFGQSRLNVRAPRTGRSYLFDRPGAIVAVDPRDLRSLAQVPQLRQVRSP